jgi:hypothetical protein
MTVQAVRPATTPVRAPRAPKLNDPSVHPGLDPQVTKERIRQGRIAEMTADRLPDSVVAQGEPAYFES